MKPKLIYFRFTLLFVSLTITLLSQSNRQGKLSLYDCLEATYNNNEQLKIASIEARYYKEIKRASYEIPKTSFIYTQGQFNSIYKFDNNITISQSMPFPTVLNAQKNLAKSNIVGAELKVEYVKAELGLQLKEVYYNLQHSLQEIVLLQKEDSIYDLFIKLADSKSELSKKSALEKSTTISEYYFIKGLIADAQEQINDYQLQLQTIMRSKEVPEVSILNGENRILQPDTASKNSLNHPFLVYLKEKIEVNERIKKLEINKGFPDVMVSYFNQSIYGPANIFGTDYFLTTANRLQGFQVGLAIPLFFLPHHAKVKAASVLTELAEEQYQLGIREMDGKYKRAINAYLMTKKNMDYYDTNILNNAREMIAQSLEAYNNKEITYIEYLSIISKSHEIERKYLHLILQNNMAVVQIDYLLNKP